MSETYDDFIDESALLQQEEAHRTCGENAAKKASANSSKPRTLARVEGKVSNWGIPIKYGHIKHDWECTVEERLRRMVWTKTLLSFALKALDHVVYDTDGNFDPAGAALALSGLRIFRARQPDAQSPLARRRD